MTRHAAALLLLAAIAIGWHTARYHRARRDLDGAKAGVKRAARVLASERKPFLVIAGIIVVVVWWWLHKHAG